MTKDSNALFWLWIDLEPYQLGLFAEYLDTLETFLKSEIQEHSRRLRKLSQERLRQLKKEMEAASETMGQVSPLAFDSFFPTSEEEVIYHEQQLLDHFGTILRRSFLVAVYSSTEAQLNRFCRLLETELNLPIPLEKVEKCPDQSIERAKKYLVEEAKVNFPESEEWKRLVAYKRVRNQVVHNEGLLPSDEEIQKLSKRKRSKIKALNKALKEYIVNHPHLALSTPASGQSVGNHRPEIIIHKGFCEEIVATCEKFFQDLNAVVYNKLAT